MRIRLSHEQALTSDDHKGACIMSLMFYLTRVVVVRARDCLLLMSDTLQCVSAWLLPKGFLYYPGRVQLSPSRRQSEHLLVVHHKTGMVFLVSPQPSPATCFAFISRFQSHRKSIPGTSWGCLHLCLLPHPPYVYDLYLSLSSFSALPAVVLHGVSVLQTVIAPLFFSATLNTAFFRCMALETTVSGGSALQTFVAWVLEGFAGLRCPCSRVKPRDFGKMSALNHGKTEAWHDIMLVLFARLLVRMSRSPAEALGFGHKL